MRHLRYIILLLSICCALNVSAQTVISKTPVKNEQEVKDKLFNLGKDKHNHFFKVALPDDNFLLIDFYRMSYWPDTSDLQNICDIAASTIDNIQSSFGNANTSKLVNIHVPVSNKPVTVKLKDNDDGTEMMVISKGESSPLKVGMDTVRVLKTYKKTKDKTEDKEVLAQIQYTFILKDLSDMSVIAGNKAIIKDVAETLGNVVKEKRSKWNKQDVWYHKIAVDYKPMETENSKKLVITNPEPPGIFKGIDFGYYIGATLFRNTVAPSLEVGSSYQFPIGGKEFAYLRASFVVVPLFERASQSKFDFFSANFACLEFGSLINRPKSAVPIYTTSIGLGYMFSDHPTLKPYDGYKMFFHYGVTPSIRVTADFYLLNFKGPNDQVWSGLTVAMKLF